MIEAEIANLAGAVEHLGAAAIGMHTQARAAAAQSPLGLSAPAGIADRDDALVPALRREADEYLSAVEPLMLRALPEVERLAQLVAAVRQAATTPNRDALHAGLRAIADELTRARMEAEDRLHRLRRTQERVRQVARESQARSHARLSATPADAGRAHELARTLRALDDRIRQRIASTAFESPEGLTVAVAPLVTIALGAGGTSGRVSAAALLGRTRAANDTLRGLLADKAERLGDGNLAPEIRLDHGVDSTIGLLDHAASGLIQGAQRFAGDLRVAHDRIGEIERELERGRPVPALRAIDNGRGEVRQRVRRMSAAVTGLRTARDPDSLDALIARTAI